MKLLGLWMVVTGLLYLTLFIREHRGRRRASVLMGLSLLLALQNFALALIFLL